ncbi:acyl-CoA thioesterase [Ralstonia sp. UBA689]|uniref:acyl-CoA thioesterase n=1 Tax=Ralstonia sp. UBA689 TaxID=1947373 RepID=UPI0025F2E27D|nr:thioesterase family protein [Ralstonia sp. UBA689]
MTTPAITDFPLQSTDKLRYGDTDRQGHVNNAVFATYLETGRVEMLFTPDNPLAAPGCEFVIAQLVLDFRNEILWPGSVQIGTRVANIGRSSVKLDQAIFQNGRCAATAQTVIVQIDTTTRQSAALTESTRARLAALAVTPAGAETE